MERLQRLQYTDLINYNSEYQRAEKAWDMVNLQMASLSAKCAAANNSYEQATKSLDASIKDCEQLGTPSVTKRKRSGMKRKSTFPR